LIEGDLLGGAPALQPQTVARIAEANSLCAPILLTGPHRPRGVRAVEVYLAEPAEFCRARRAPAPGGGRILKPVRRWSTNLSDIGGAISDSHASRANW